MTNDSGSLPLADEDGLGDARRNRDGLLAVLVSEDVGPGQIGSILHVATGRADQLARELAVVVTAQAAVLRAVGSGDHVGDVVSGVAESQLEDRSLDEVAGADLADDDVLDHVVLVGQNVGLVRFDLDNLVVSLHFNSASGRGQLQSVAADVDLGGQRQTLGRLPGENGVARSRRAVGRDESVASGEVVVHRHVVESNDSLGSNVANADPTGLDGRQLGNLQTGVAEHRAQVLEDIDVLVVAVHQVSVDVDVDIFLADFHLQFNVAGTGQLLDSGGAVRGVHGPVRQQRSLEKSIGAGESHLSTRRHVLVVDVQDVAARSSVVQDGLVASLST